MSVAALRGSSLWPSLVEKAYMKYSGGYDFAGSDSGVDLRALIGWIPDHHSLQSATFERERTWREMLDAFRKGDVLVTLGTGSTVSSLNPEIRLIPLHSYACIGLEDDEDRTVTIVNPWREQEQEPNIENGIHSLTLKNLEADPSKGKWLLSWDDVCRTFDSLYLNWNSDIFPYTLTHHRAWNPQEKHDHSPTQNHQIRVIFEKDPGTTQVWALLSRHIVDHDAPAVYIALHAFEEDGNGISFNRPESLTLMGQYQEGPHCLVKLTPGTETKRLSLIASLSVPDGVTAPAQVAYTLTVYSKVPISFDASVPPALIKQHVTFQFNTLHSGGNILQPTHFQNPQWQLKVLEPTLKKGPIGPVALRSRGVRVRFHAIAPKDLPLNIKVYRTSGRRMNDVEDGVLAFDSGMYNYGLAYGQTDLFPGSYIIILSNFVVTQYGGGTLEMSSEARLELQKSPAEGAGMHFKSCRGRWDGPSAAGGPSFHRYWHNPVFELKLERNTEVALKLQMLDIKQGTPYIPINLAIFKRDTVDGEQIEKEVATSGPYRESLYGVRVRPCRIPAGLYFVVASTYSPGTQGSFEILLWSDSLLALKSLE
ncbi:cysteine protease [Serendipita sp. 397]|nr:cysteine protease [Serendipita sp. 397]